MPPTFVPVEVDDAPMGTLTTGLIGTWIIDGLILLALIWATIELTRIRTRVNQLQTPTQHQTQTEPATKTSKH